MGHLQQFWAPRQAYEPTGMFSRGHLILAILCFAVLHVLLYRTREIRKENIRKLTRKVAILMTALEGVKICYSFYWGYTWINAWVPIAYCSIFIYALWLSGYGSGKWKSMGDTFLAGCAIVGGTTYLIFPSTSLMMYPMWHYQSLYSMFFHTLMIWMGILYLRTNICTFSFRSYLSYSKLYVFFAVLAITLNTATQSNLMLLREPFKIPVPFLHDLYEKAPWGYTVLVFVVYLVVPYGITASIWRRIQLSNEKDSIDLHESFQ